MDKSQSTNSERASSGIEGFDQITGGGFRKKRIYLVEGDPGVGKTTFALQFLIAGAEIGEKVLLISLAETLEELQEVSESHGLNLDKIEIFNLTSEIEPESEYTVLEPFEVELNDTMEKIFAEVRRVKPSRVVFDSLSELRLLAQTTLRYRRQILTLKRHFLGLNCTVLLLDDRAGDSNDVTLQSLVHGVVELQKYSPVYGKARRKIQVVKMRGVNFNAGFHDFNIVAGGLVIYPRLAASDHIVSFTEGVCQSGVKQLDEMLGAA